MEAGSAQPKRSDSAGRRRTRWRAGILIAVQLLMVAHYVHWKLAGKTLAPLELNEVMHTIELGVITAGFLFMAAAFLATVAFGRFFCGWGCHILALQDLCAAGLRRIGLKPRPIRSRLLLAVAPLTALYMFVWPTVARLIVQAYPATESVLGSRPEFRLRVLGDGEGWASFVTSDYARNLPGPVIAILTFVVAGFVIVWLLGSRSFCGNICPYGVLFRVADGLSPGRIAIQGDCLGCNACTRTCSSGIQVREEVNTFGRVVDPRCLKDMDCVDVCSGRVLRWKFTKPAFFQGWRRGRSRIPWDLTLREEVLAGFLVLASLAVYRGLYRVVPFFLTLALGASTAAAVVLALRSWRKGQVRTHRGRVAAAVLAVGLLIYHAPVRWHEFMGDRIVHRIRSREGPDDRGDLLALIGHLEARERWGWVHPPDIDVSLSDALRRLGRHVAAAEVMERRLAKASLRASQDRSLAFDCARAWLLAGRAAQAERWADRIVDALTEKGQEKDHGEELWATLELRADARLRQGRLEEAESDLRRVAAQAPGRPSVELAISQIDAESGRLDEAIRRLDTLVRRHPDLAFAHYNLGVLLAARGDKEAAIRAYRRTLDLAPADGDALNNLGLLLMDSGRLGEAEMLFRKALALHPSDPRPARNLTVLLRNLH